MSGALEGRRVLVTGAGRGMGREHARLFASEGARLVVNDNGAERDGKGSDPSVVAAIAAELAESGAEVLASDDDITTMAGAETAIGRAIDEWGGIDVVVNNAGILRDRMFVNMTEDEWDVVIRGHLKSTFCTTRIAAGHWRDRAKAGDEVHASVVNVSSTSGLMGAVGQSNYGAAKAGIAAMTVILAEELGRYGVRCNAIVPVARTRMTEEVAGIADVVKAPDDPAEFDVFHPANVAPVVAWLATEGCAATGRVLYVRGGEVRLVEGWHYVRSWEHGGPTSIADVDEAIGALLAGDEPR